MDQKKTSSEERDLFFKRTMTYARPYNFHWPSSTARPKPLLMTSPLSYRVKKILPGQDGFLTCSVSGQRQRRLELVGRNHASNGLQVVKGRFDSWPFWANCITLTQRLLPHGLVVTSGASVSAIDRNSTRDVRQSCQRIFSPYPQKVSERGPCFGLFYIESYGGGYLARTGKSGSNMSAKQLNFTDLLTSMLVNK
ncbi:hypothetical protein OUZ56_023890 [Daphnia magna]|uniref:Uncharacterized protein n=1 Tax=Daphnia magna TaxID=35525 RepID=A0ABR0B0E6_9CRUS|nr:hypothetical protein OUZ56_023890 [Daphnia magna]